MKIVFMGTPEFAVPPLERLYRDGHDILGVFTQPDRPKNRGMKLAFSPAKQLALSRGTPVFQPETLKDGGALQILRGLSPELIAVVAYGRVLPRGILELPPRGCVNIHGSLLPKYRGAAPIQRAVLCGETRTGVTSMFMSEGLDEGDIIYMRETDIGERETAGELYDRLSEMGAELLSETLTAISRGDAPRQPQNGADASFAPPLTKELSPIDWAMDPNSIMCKIRGLNPWPVATAELFGTRFKIYSAAAVSEEHAHPAGTVVSADGDGIKVACTGGTVIIKELQAAGGKRMAAADYLRGHKIWL